MEAKRQMVQSEGLEFVVLEGVQAGATSVLEPGQRVVIGADLDSDIILRDRVIQDYGFSLELKDGLVELQMLKGSIDIDGKAVSQGEVTMLEPYQAARLGETAFALSAAGDAEVQDKIAERAKAVVAASVVAPKKQKSLGLKVAVFFFIFTSVVAPLGYWFIHRHQAPVVVVTPQQRANELTQTLHSANFSGLKVKVSTTGELVIAGYLKTTKSRGELERFLEQMALALPMTLVVGEVVASQVNDVYRLHGISAQTTTVQPGVIEVSTQELDLDKLALVEQKVMKDVANVTDLVRKNDIETAASVADDIEPPPPDPGKKITMVVRGEPAYIVTADKSRYFVGAMLPTGHKIIGINPTNVLLIRNGVVTELDI